MTIKEAKMVIYANVVYACEKAEFPPMTIKMVKDACDTVIALAEQADTPQTDLLVKTPHKSRESHEKKTEPQTVLNDYSKADDCMECEKFFDCDAPDEVKHALRVTDCAWK